MKLSILIPHLAHRDVTPLLTKLLDQAAGHPVEVLIETDSGELTSGQKRNKLMQQAKGEYVAFVDDDDDVSSIYVSSLLQGVRASPDVVSFNLFYQAPDHTEVWRFGLHRNSRPHGLMAINHLCAWRRTLAERVMWCPHLGFKDDHLWFEPLVHSNLVETVWAINRELYIYQYHPQVTRQQTSPLKEYTKKYIGPGLTCYMDHDQEIYIQCQRNPVYVRNRHNEVLPLNPTMIPYHIIR